MAAANGGSNERSPLLPGGGGGAPPGCNGAGDFGVTAEQLTAMLDPKDPGMLEELGGPDQICKALQVDPKVGLRQREQIGSSGRQQQEPFQARRAAFGRNTLPEASQVTFWQLLYAAYNDRTLIMLTIASAVSLAVGVYDDMLGSHKDDEVKVGWVEGAAIFLAVLVVCFTNAINDYQKEKQFQRLNSKKEDRTVKVRRDGNEVEIGVQELNVGDVLLIEPGDIVPVDGIYLEGHNITCDESSATGESDAIKKGSVSERRDPFILSGAKVLEGVGSMVVVAVGARSFYGKIMMAMRQGSAAATPLQRKLDVLAEQIAKYGMSAAILLLVTLTVKYVVNCALAPEFPPASEMFSQFVSIAIESITVVVVAVPEGLPMAVTIALAYATTRMLKDGNLVRQLAACETMGGATVVCTDKTGTLTQNRMTVVRGFVAERELQSRSEAHAFYEQLPQATRSILLEGIAVNSTAFEGPDESGAIDFIGSKSECALLGFSKTCGLDYRCERADNPPARVYPFSSEKKTMTTVIPVRGTHGQFRVHAKGASEIVLRACTRYVDGDGAERELTESVRTALQQRISAYAHQALRTFALAFKEIGQSELDACGDDAPLEGLVWLGVMGIQDPLRPGVRQAVDDCRRAGVIVRMITGDNIETARAIARDAGILTKGGQAVAGPQWRQMTPEQQHALLPRLQVMARSSPLDKQIMVERLQERGEVVTVSGDGTNDAPSLQRADVGFSMGIAGTEVAKEASDIILMDDDFKSIVKALRWGRAVNDSVRKFLQFQLTVNITAVLLTFTSSVFSADGQSALTAVQLLWVNMIMDTLAALALATEGPTDAVLDRPPQQRNSALITFEMWRMILGQAAFQVSINLLLLNHGLAVFHLPADTAGLAVLRTTVFNSFVFLQVFNQINCRRIQPDEFNVFANIQNDSGFLLVQLFIIAAQWLIVSYGGVAFSTVPLSLSQWAGSLFIGLLSLPVGLLIRMLPDLSACFGLEGANSAAQQHLPEVSTARMRMEASVKDVQYAVRFFSAIRNSQLAKQSGPDDYATNRNFLAGPSSRRASTMPSSDCTTAAPTAAVSTSSSWARVKKAVDNPANE
ncbi:calcium-translocating P-type ATPase [Coemansia reversa NRRL 1564]|uniref:Calcium-transporting ATPase n=1 Tax=Coemansia reversa (strain ATCC 12441 / NRRL 1564) TaxID=763665 RepID=A0A2G5B340_COERN|nr:calcium-translocating P-type ATPase [Coemansia reversa NRRL 1564]|eukprot:PIA13438.1 calcium-translocating P-type ATPase [Coemansia reversa NRRL 1564]